MALQGRLVGVYGLVLFIVSRGRRDSLFGWHRRHYMARSHKRAPTPIISVATGTAMGPFGRMPDLRRSGVVVGSTRLESRLHCAASLCDCAFAAGWVCSSVCAQRYIGALRAE